MSWVFLICFWALVLIIDCIMYCAYGFGDGIEKTYGWGVTPALLYGPSIIPILLLNRVPRC